MGDFLPGDRPWWDARRWWQVAFALVVTVALTVGGVHWLSDLERTAGGEDGPSVSVAQGFADAALAAFSTSTTVAAGPALTPAQRSAGLPTEPVAGLTSHTPAGPVQVVLPDGLGAAQSTSGGQVVYPDAGAGFDMLAENTGTGTRTVARINGPDGVRMVTTFVRTPADTVMLAHTNGYLTINRATPTAETVGMFSPAETRDATGRLVPASYVVKQVAPQIYALAEVIDPRPDTVWPVYVDPPLHVGGLPAGLFDSITSTISSVTDTVASAASTAMSTTVSGVKAVGTFVKENPLESAMLVGGVALALTGVGGPASAAMIASATVNLTSAGLDIASAAMPDNQALANVATGFGIASAFTPQGAAKNVVKEGAELAAEQLAKHADDLTHAAESVVDVAKAGPTPPTQLVDDITAKTPVPGVSTPKAPNAPPAVASDIPEGLTVPGGEHAWALPPAPGDRRLSTDITSRVSPRTTTRKDIEVEKNVDGVQIDSASKQVLGPKPDIGHREGQEFRTTQDMARDYGLSRREVVEWENDPERLRWENPSTNRGHQYENPRPSEEMYTEYKDWLKSNAPNNPKLAQDPTVQRRLANMAEQSRPTGATQQRQIQEVNARKNTDEQRNVARQSAQAANQGGSRSSSQGDNDSGNNSHKKNSNSKQKKKKSKPNHPKPKG